MTTWTRLPAAEVGRTLGPDGPLQCTHRAWMGGEEEASRCGGPLGHEPIGYGRDTILWAHEPLVAGHDMWPEIGKLIDYAGGHIWYCDRGPLSLCGRCGLAYSRWSGDDCPALGPEHGPWEPTIEDYRAMEDRLSRSDASASEPPKS